MKKFDRNKTCIKCGNSNAWFLKYIRHPEITLHDMVTGKTVDAEDDFISAECCVCEYKEVWNCLDAEG